MIMTQATANKITYTYQHCSAEDFTHQVSFSEEEFNKQIAQIFNTHLPIDRVELEFVLQDKKTGHFLVIIECIRQNLIFTIKKKPTVITLLLCVKPLRQL